MARLELDLTVALRAFELRARLSAGRETLALAGPSGAGKTTLLRAVAGLARPRAGRIALGEHVWFDARAGIDLPPERRSVGMVFQDLALFPHLSVARNVAFGAAPGEDAGELLERLGIAPLADERPGALSGGERQRVALARALARRPEVLLLDEPLTALDPRTRLLVRDELAALLATLEIPALLVTHDFDDAAALAARIAVIADGRVRQCATAAELLDRPADAAVAAFTGANVLPGTGEGGAAVRLDDGRLAPVAARAHGRVAVVLHPWELSVVPGGPDRPPPGTLAALPGVIGAVARDGERRRVRLGGLTVHVPPAQAAPLEPGMPAWSAYDPAAARVLPLD